MAYSDEVTADSPVAYWRLGEPSGTTATDETANGLDGTYNGTPTLGATGLLVGDADDAVTFDNTDDYVNVADNDLLDFGTGDFTVECWFSRSTTDDWGCFVSKKAHTGNTPGWELTVSNVDLLRFRTRDSNSSNLDITDISAYFDGEPHHLVATRDASTGDMRVYMDTVEIGELAGATVRDVSSTQSLRIGRQNELTTFFSGTLDEVAVYDSLLSEARIQAHYDSGTGAAADQTVEPTALGGATLHSPQVNLSVSPTALGGASLHAPTVHQQLATAALGPATVNSPQVNISAELTALGGASLLNPSVQNGLTAELTALGGASIYDTQINIGCELVALGTATLYSPQGNLATEMALLDVGALFDPGINQSVELAALGGATVSSPQIDLVVLLAALTGASLHDPSVDGGTGIQPRRSRITQEIVVTGKER